MAETPPINIRIDEEALREQVRCAISDALTEVSWKFRSAADALDPGFVTQQNEWIEAEIERRVAEGIRDDAQ